MSNTNLGKTLDRIAVVVSVIVLLLVGAMRRIHIDVPFDTTVLPPIYSFMNVLCSITLIMALVFVKQKNIKAHQLMINLSMLFSLAFLLMYVAYHLTSGHVNYVGEYRTIYLMLLITHIVLAAVSFPFILFTWIRGYTNQVEKHRKMAKYTYPMWLYVAVTGPICYLMLYGI